MNVVQILLIGCLVGSALLLGLGVVVSLLFMEIPLSALVVLVAAHLLFIGLFVRSLLGGRLAVKQGAIFLAFWLAIYFGTPGFGVFMAIALILLDVALALVVFRVA